MAVYTKLAKAELIDHLKQYQIGELVDFKGIVAGIDNSNFIVRTSQAKFILTIFESRINDQDLPFFIELTNHLAKHQICCPKPIANRSGEFLTKLKAKSSTIVTFLEGKMLETLDCGLYNSINQNHCFEIGKITAQMHLAVADFKMTRKNDLGVTNFSSFFAKFSHFVDEFKPNLKNKINSLIKDIGQKWQNLNLPSGVIHSDLFPDNVFFDYDQNNLPKVSGVIDFYFAANDLFIYDFACITNAWCFDGENKFVGENFENLIRGYQSVRLFQEQEIKTLQISLIAASLRFLLTRLHDYFFTPKDSLVRVKDPQEYIDKLDFFLSYNFKDDKI